MTFSKSIPNSWSNQEYVQGFDYKNVTSEKAINMFKLLEIAEYIYKGVVEPSV